LNKECNILQNLRNLTTDYYQPFLLHLPLRTLSVNSTAWRATATWSPLGALNCQCEYSTSLYLSPRKGTAVCDISVR